MKAEYSISRDAPTGKILARGICISFNKKRDSEEKMTFILDYMSEEGWSATSVDEDVALDFYFSYKAAPMMKLLREDWVHFKRDYEDAKKAYKEKV